MRISLANVECISTVSGKDMYKYFWLQNDRLLLVKKYKYLGSVVKIIG